MKGLAYTQTTVKGLSVFRYAYKALAIVLDYSFCRLQISTRGGTKLLGITGKSQQFLLTAESSGGKTYSDNAGSLLLGYNSHVKDTDGVDFSCFTAALHPRRPQWKW